MPVSTKSHRNIDELIQENAELQKEIAALKKRKKFGLVWEDKPEDVVERCKSELPVLQEVKQLSIDGDDNLQTNLLIEGDNYHALSVLNYTHAGKIDVVYIDPPYNTGARDWKYNNDYVDKADGYRHSKWLSMMASRLELAKNLLSENGFICVAIDHNELFTLGCLLDDIFGEKNRLGVVAIRHHPRGRTQSHFFSTVHEYALFYGKDSTKTPSDFRFEVNDTEEVISFVRSREDSTPEMRPNLYYPIFYNPETEEITLVNGGEGFVEILPASQNGERTWGLVQESFLDELRRGKISVEKARRGYKVFRTVVREKYKAKTMWTNTKYDANHNGSELLKKLFGGARVFDFPKSLYTVMDTIKLVADKNSVVLDFFAGSGTTGHAVLALNKEDDGSRQYILCTNNENGIARDVCQPRIKAVIKGHPDLPDITGIPSNLKYYKANFVSSTATDANKIKITNRATEMLCVRENTFCEVEITQSYKIFRNQKCYTGIIYDSEAINSFKQAIAQIDGTFNVYVFSLGGEDFAEEFADMGNKVITQSIPESILQTYRQIFKG